MFLKGNNVSWKRVEHFLYIRNKWKLKKNYLRFEIEWFNSEMDFLNDFHSENSKIG